MEVGDMRPKLSAASTSGDGCIGVKARSSSVAAGVADLVGVAEFDSRWLNCRLGAFARSGEGSFVSAAGNSFNIGTTGIVRPIGFT